MPFYCYYAEEVVDKDSMDRLKKDIDHLYTENLTLRNLLNEASIAAPGSMELRLGSGANPMPFHRESMQQEAEVGLLKRGPGGSDSGSSNDLESHYEVRGSPVQEHDNRSYDSSSPNSRDSKVQEYNQGAYAFFRSAVGRGGWLSGLLIFQSFSSVILLRHVELIQSHPNIVYFLLMLVGAGGNAGNQAAVRAIRGIALKTLHSGTVKPFLWHELKMGLVLSVMLGACKCVLYSDFCDCMPTRPSMSHMCCTH